MQKEHEEEMIVLEGALRKDSKEEVRQAKDEMVRKQKHELERIQEQHEHELEVRSKINGVLFRISSLLIII